MKTKDQQLLEEAYGLVSKSSGPFCLSVDQETLNEGIWSDFKKQASNFIHKNEKYLHYIAMGGIVFLAALGVIKNEKEYDRIAEIVQQQNMSDYERLMTARKNYDRTISARIAYGEHKSRSSSTFTGMDAVTLLAAKDLENIVKELKEKYNIK